MQRIGFFGGSFNPIHIAHTIHAMYFVEQMKLDHCVFVPTYKSPFKVSDIPFVDDIDRIRMVELAIKGNENFSIDDFEIKQQKVSYTIDTVHHLKHKYPNSQLYLLIGEDQARLFQSWHLWREIVDTVQLCITRRALKEVILDQDFYKKLASSEQRPPIWINAPFIDISSTEIRHRLATKRPITNLVHPEVERYINVKGFYTP
jgi:nicotinate-nucleotide adenylyltransferase